MRNFPDFIEAYLQYTAGHEATPRIHLWSCLSAIAGALERRVWLDRGYYTLYPNLYVFIIGKSGLIKKSTSTAVAVNLLRELENIKIMSDRLTATSLITQLQGAQKTFTYDNFPVKQAPVFAYASELSVFLTDVFGSTQELLTTFFDCVPHDSSKPWTYETVGRGAIKIFGPCLNMLGASTQTWLKKCVPASEMEGGFASRIIFVVENGGPQKLVAWPEVGANQEKFRTKLVEDLYSIYRLTGKFRPTVPAVKYFTDWYKFHMNCILPAQTDPKWAGYYGRKGDMILKLSMIRSASQRGDLIIGEQDILWAGARLEELESDMIAAFEGVGTNPMSGLTFGIRDFIKKNGGVAAKVEILRAFAQQAPGTEVSRALSDLIEMHEISVTQESRHGNAPQPVYRVRPKQG